MRDMEVYWDLLIYLLESHQMKKSTKLKPTLEFDTSSISSTQMIWGLDFYDYLPMQLTSEIKVEIIPYTQAQPLIEKYFPEIYHYQNQKQTPSKLSIDSHLQADPHDHELKLKYYQNFGDFFVFTNKKQEFAGIAVGTLLDWSSYYFRNMAIMPEFRGQELYPKFFDLLCSLLKKHHVLRVEGDICPTNRHHLHILNKMGYLVTGVTLTERWGPLVHVTKYLDEKDEERFGQLFSGTFSSDKDSNKKHQKNKKISNIRKFPKP